MGLPERLGRYEILSTLGHGSMGVVYLAYDPVIDRKVALKTLRMDYDRRFGREVRERFVREARAAGRLSHPNIVTVFDVVEEPEQETAFIAMEYLSGTSLRDALCSGMRFDPSSAVDFGIKVAEALAYAHSEGVVHRDVKPANIILGAHGEVAITDFGLARLDASDLTIEGAVLGSPQYMSPEQISGRQVDGRSDLYSLGVILFELLTGARPFKGSSLPELSVTIVNEAPANPATLAAGLPVALSQIILRCLAKEPGDRFQNGRDLANALREADLQTSLITGNAEDQTPPDYRGAETLVRETPAAPPLPDQETVYSLPAEDAITDMIRQPGRVHPATAGRTRWSRWSWIAAGAVATILAAVIVMGVFSGGPQQEQIAEPAITPTATLESAMLEIVHENRLREAQITVSMDDIQLWSARLPPPESLAESLAGRRSIRALPIPEGAHRISVKISGRLSKIEAQSSIEGEFHMGRTRQLDVTLDSATHTLALAWLH